jgi:hypothetical protein
VLNDAEFFFSLGQAISGVSEGANKPLRLLTSETQLAFSLPRLVVVKSLR